MRRPAGKFECVLLVLNKMPLCWSSLFLPPCRDGYSVGCNGRTSRSGRLSSMGSPALEEDGIFLNSNNSKLLERAQGILMWVTYHKVTVVFLFACLFLIILNPVYHARSAFTLQACIHPCTRNHTVLCSVHFKLFYLSPTHSHNTSGAI